MAYTNFKSIPAEAVETDEATWHVIDTILRHPENKKICEACMSEIKKRYSDDPKPYRARAFRRAAILVANADCPLVSAKGKERLTHYKSDHFGLPCGTTSAFINAYVREELMKRRIEHNIYACFPPSWSNGLVMSIHKCMPAKWQRSLLRNNWRSRTALELLDFFINRSVPNWCIKWGEYSRMKGHEYEAFIFYAPFTKYELTVMRDRIQNFIKPV